MLTPEQVQGLQVAFERLSDPLVETLIADIARRVSEAGQLTSTAAYEIWRAQNLGKSREFIENAVADWLGKSIPEVQELFKQAAEVGYNFDVSRLPVEAIPFAENESIQQIVNAAVNLADEELKNITQTLGVIQKNGEFSSLTDYYQSASDEAFMQVSTGVLDYNTAIRRACNALAQRGIQTINYDSGVRTSLEAAIRRNMMGGLGLMVENITKKNHDDLGCDGWEISAHANSAPDHEPIQGRQYPDKEYERLNSSLKRRIGTLNCGHNASPIILGVNQSQYTKSELEKFRADNEKGVDYEGKHFNTVYEATQYQRRMERAIRAEKRKIIIAENQPDKENLQSQQIRLQTLKQRYQDFCRKTGLRTEDERLFVSGFGKKQAAKAEKTAKKQLEISRKNAIIESEIRTAGNLAKQAKIHLTPQPINTDVLEFDDEHINRDRKHNVTKEQAVNWIRHAKISVTVWNGRYERYYAADGISYVDLDNKMIRTAYSAEEFDEHVKDMMEVLKKHGILS